MTLTPGYGLRSVPPTRRCGCAHRRCFAPRGKALDLDPNGKHAATYDRGYGEFRQLYEALRPLFERQAHSV
jgi:hypothetical protein